MESIVQIRITNDYYNTEENRKVITELYSAIIDKAVELGIWDDSIKAIIVTDDFINEIEKQAVEWNIRTHFSKEKGYCSAVANRKSTGLPSIASCIESRILYPCFLIVEI